MAMILSCARVARSCKNNRVARSSIPAWCCEYALFLTAGQLQFALETDQNGLTVLETNIFFPSACSLLDPADQDERRSIGSGRGEYQADIKAALSRTWIKGTLRDILYPQLSICVFASFLLKHGCCSQGRPRGCFRHLLDLCSDFPTFGRLSQAGMCLST